MKYQHKADKEYAYFKCKIKKSYPDGNEFEEFIDTINSFFDKVFTI